MPSNVSILTLLGPPLLFCELALADSAVNYRDAFLSQCMSGNEEGLTCECVFDRWVERMDNPSSAGAVAAARLAANPKRQPSARELEIAAPHLQALGRIGFECAEEMYGRTAQPGTWG